MDQRTKDHINNAKEHRHDDADAMKQLRMMWQNQSHLALEWLKMERSYTPGALNTVITMEEWARKTQEFVRIANNPKKYLQEIAMKEKESKENE